ISVPTNIAAPDHTTPGAGRYARREALHFGQRGSSPHSARFAALRKCNWCSAYAGTHLVLIGSPTHHLDNEPELLSASSAKSQSIGPLPTSGARPDRIGERGPEPRGQLRCVPDGGGARLPCRDVNRVSLESWYVRPGRPPPASSWLP